MMPSRNTWDAIRGILYNPRRCSNPDSALAALAEHLGRSLSHADVPELDEVTAARAVRFLDENYPDRTSGVVGRVMEEK